MKFKMYLQDTLSIKHRTQISYSSKQSMVTTIKDSWSGKVVPP